MVLTFASPGAAQARQGQGQERGAAGHGGAADAALRGQLAEALRQIARMRAQLDALQVRVDQAAAAEASERARLAAQDEAVGSATAKADKALVAAHAAEAAAVASPSPETMDWAAATQLSGRVFLDFSHIDQTSNGVATAASGTGLNIKRAYLTIDHRIDSRFSFDITTDIANVVGQTGNGNFQAPANAGDLNLAGRGLFVKNAYLQAKLSPAVILRFGAAPLAWIPFVESQYGYRHIENEALDRIGYGGTADWGVHVLGDLGHVLSYQLSVIDGGGYRNVRVTRWVDVEGRIAASYDGFFAAVGGYVGKRGNAVAGVPTYHTARRLDVAAGYRNALFTLGGEYVFAKDWNNVTLPGEDAASGFSLFGNVNFAPKWSAFARYDWVEPNRLSHPGLRDHYVNAGIQYEPVSVLDLALVYKRDAADNGTIATSNGTIGGSAGGTYHEVGLFGQVRF